MNQLEEKPRNPYLVDGIPKVQRSYCAYLDILGFEDLIRKHAERGQTQKLFDKVSFCVYWNLSELDPPFDVSERRYYLEWQRKLFSDNLVLGCPIHDGQEDSEIVEIIHALGKFQMAMIMDYFFIRGGLAVGDLCIDDKVVFGPALIEAFKIEDEVAGNPRVVISKNLFDFIKSNFSKWPQRILDHLKEAILLDQDAKPFINYLYLAFYRTTIDDSDISSIRDHKRRIEDQLKQFKDRPEIWSKYVWAANYHDYFIKSIQGDPCYEKQASLLNDCLINAKFTSYEYGKIV